MIYKKALGERRSHLDLVPPPGRSVRPARQQTAQVWALAIALVSASISSSVRAMNPCLAKGDLLIRQLDPVWIVKVVANDALNVTLVCAGHVFIVNLAS